MSKRLKESLDAIHSQNTAFVAFVTAGYPSLDDTVSVLLALENGGADIIELGIPHSDPIADGPTIQEASNVALQNGITFAKCLQFVSEARSKGLTCPVILMGYANPFHAHGFENAIRQSKDAGADGFIVVDLPPEESHDFRTICKQHSMNLIHLVAPVTSLERMHYIDSVSDSFVYCVSVLGVTGTRNDLPPELPHFVANVKKNIRHPLMIGFGISTSEQFEQVGRLGDGVVVGSAIVKALGAAHSKKESVAEAATRIAKYFAESKKSIPKILPQVQDDVQSGTTKNPASAKTDVSVDGKAQVSSIPAFFGKFGGRYAPETLIGALEELERAYVRLREDPTFQEEIKSYYDFVGRPTPLYFCDRLSKEVGGAQIWLKREDLAHTGAHKINNAIGQALIAKKLGKTRIIAETGAGQHGVATATICAKMGLECVVYMGAEDVRRQSPNVFRMKLLGAKVVVVESGSKTLKDAINEAMRDWVTNIKTTHYLVGSAIGPHPFPTIVRDLQSVIGKEARAQMLNRVGRLPDLVVACVGGGSNSIGMFHPFTGDKEVKLLGVEAAGHGLHTNKHCGTLQKGTTGILHGTKTKLLQDNEGQISDTHSISAGLDYPGVGPEHAFLQDSLRAEYVAVDDKQAMEGFHMMTTKEGIIPALETSHAIYQAVQEAAKMKPDQIVLVCMSGRGDKDLGTVATEFGISLN